MRSLITGVVLGLSGSLPGAATEAYELNINRGYVNFVAEAHGYCVGQDALAEQISNDFPDLEWPTKRALTLFEAGTGNACGKSEELLRKAMGEHFDEMQAGAVDRIRSLIEEQPMSQALAAEFVAEIERRARWEIEAPFIEALLSVRYQDRPAAEMWDGHVQRFSTLGHPKSLGVNATLQAPLSWKGDEGERPQIVRKWRSQGGFGKSMIHLDIRDSEDLGRAVTYADVEALAATDDPFDMVESGGMFHSARALRHETLPAITVQYDMLKERTGITLLMRMTMHQVFLANRVVGIMCQTMGLPEEAEVIAAEFDAMSPVCREVLNSLVLHDVW